MLWLSIQIQVQMSVGVIHTHWTEYLMKHEFESWQIVEWICRIFWLLVSVVVINGAQEFVWQGSHKHRFGSFPSEAFASLSASKDLLPSRLYVIHPHLRTWSGFLRQVYRPKYILKVHKFHKAIRLTRILVYDFQRPTKDFMTLQSKPGIFDMACSPSRDNQPAERAVFAPATATEFN